MGRRRANFGKLVACLGEGHGRVLIDQRLVKSAERLVLLIRSPALPVESHQNDVFSVRAIFFFNDLCGLNRYRQRNLEKVTSGTFGVLVARSCMLSENLSWLEGIAVLALE